MDHVTGIVILGAIAAGFVQGLSGFAFSMVALSFWAWVIDPHLAAAMAVFGALTGQILTAITHRRAFNLKQIYPYIIGGIAGIPIGIAILPLLNPLLFKAVLGTVLVIWCPFMLVAHSLPRIKTGGLIANSIIGIAGGAMGAIGGVSGIVPTLWCTLRGYEKQTQRSIIQSFSLATLSITMATYIAKG